MLESRQFPGGVFSDRVPDGRAGAQISVQPTCVRGQTNDGTPFDIPFTELQLELGGASGRMLFCRNAGRTVTLFCEDPGLRAELRTLGSSVLQPQLQEQLGQIDLATRRRSAGAMAWIVGGVALLVALVLGTPPTLRWLAGRAVEALPYSVDQKIGQVAVATMEMGGPRVDAPVVVGAIETIVSRLDPKVTLGDSPVKFRVRVIESPVDNAFALPGGEVVVYTGLLRNAKSADEVAGVIAHEMAHVLERHGVERIAKSLGVVGVAQLVLGDASGVVAVAAQALTLAAINSYSREQEAAADQRAVLLLHASGLQVQPLCDFFLRLKANQQTDGTELPSELSWLSTHPDLQARADALTAAWDKLPKTENRPLEIDWPAVLQGIGHHVPAPAGPTPAPAPSTEERL